MLDLGPEGQIGNSHEKVQSRCSSMSRDRALLSSTNSGAIKHDGCGEGTAT